MKLKQVTIAEREDGLEVSLVALLAHDEALTATGLVEAFNGLGRSAGLTGSRDTAAPEPAAPQLGADDAEFGTSEHRRATEEPQPETRRRHRNPLEAAPEATENPPTAAPAGTSPEADTGGRRRRRAAPASMPAPSPEASPASSGQSDVNPTRRRRAAPAAEASPATPTDASPAPEQAGTGERRRRAATAEGASLGTAAASPAAASSDAITDADLSKACSDAARVLTYKPVMEYLESFGVKHSGELKGADRRRFLDGLKAKKEAA